MARTTASTRERLKSRFTMLPVVLRRLHRIVGAVWVLSLALTYAFPATAAAVPGPSIPGLSFNALLVTGTYLLLRPWVRKDGTLSDRWTRLTNWNVSRSALVRRIHRVFASLVLVFIGIAISLAVTGGGQSKLVIVPVVVFLAALVLTGSYMFLRPWVDRFRTH